MLSNLILLLTYTLVYYGSLGNIIVGKLSTNQTLEVFSDAEALFGPRLSPFNPITGFVFIGKPLNGCVFAIPLPEKESEIPFIALVKRGQCLFTDKAMAAQRGNFTAVIVYNDQNDSIFPMPAVSGNSVHIPAVMVGLSDGIKLESYNFSADKDYVITIYANGDINITSFIVPVISLVGLIIFCAIVYCCFRCYARRQVRRRRCLTQAQLNTIPVITFVQGETIDSTCPICLEEFADQDKLRVLPCHHVYHAKCVDHWLLRGRRVCPVCKRPAHGRRRRHYNEANPRLARSLVGGIGQDDEAMTVGTSESDFEDDVAGQVGSRPQEHTNRAAEEGQSVGVTHPTALMEVNETTPLLASCERPAGRKWFWQRARRKRLVAGWLNSNPFPSEQSGQAPQSFASTSTMVNGQADITVGVPVTLADDCSPPQTATPNIPSTSWGLNTVQAIVHQTASPSDTAPSA